MCCTLPCCLLSISISLLPEGPLELEVPRSTQEPILHRGGKNFAYNHNLAWAHSSLLLLARHRRAMGPQQWVPVCPPGEAWSLEGTWGGQSSYGRAAGSAAQWLNHRPWPSHQARQTLAPSPPSLSKSSWRAAPHPARTGDKRRALMWRGKEPSRATPYLPFLLSLV